MRMHTATVLYRQQNMTVEYNCARITGWNEWTASRPRAGLAFCVNKALIIATVSAHVTTKRDLEVSAQNSMTFRDAPFCRFDRSREMTIPINYALVLIKMKL